MLNEACSSGCGSFIETYAKSVNIDVHDFATGGAVCEGSCRSRNEMHRIYEFQGKAGAEGGARPSEIFPRDFRIPSSRNALYKVIKLRNPEEAGEKIVVQGGTFLNDADTSELSRI